MVDACSNCLANEWLIFRKKVRDRALVSSMNLAVSSDWPMIETWVEMNPQKMNFQPSFRQRDQYYALAKINSS